MILSKLVDEEEGEIDLLRVLDGYHAILMLAIPDLEREQLEVVVQEVELDLPHPDPIEDCLALVFEGHVEEDGGLDELSVAKVRNVQIEVNRVLGEGIDAQGQRFLHGLLDALAIRKNLVDADREHL